MKQLSLQEKIYNRHFEGASAPELARAFEIPVHAVNNMISREQAKREKKVVSAENMLLQKAIEDLPTKHPQRIYNALRRIGVNSIEELKITPIESLVKCYGIGELSIKLLVSAGLICENKGE